MDAYVLACARSLGLVLNDEHAATFTSKAIRAGVAADTARTVMSTMASINPKHGRSKGSKMDLAVYCPPSVLCEPGLLLHDVDGITDFYNTSVQAHLATKKTQWLCEVCGYPKCECSKCTKKRNSLRFPYICLKRAKQI